MVKFLIKKIYIRHELVFPSIYKTEIKKMLWDRQYQELSKLFNFFYLKQKLEKLNVLPS